jgi:hypothetical protein
VVDGDQVLIPAWEITQRGVHPASVPIFVI